MTIAYSADALVYDATTDSWSLRDDYDHTDHRVTIEFEDSDDYIEGDFNNDEVGDDTSQNATVVDMQGESVASGQAYAEKFVQIESPSGVISEFDIIEINGVVVAIVVDIPFVPGVSYSVRFEADVVDAPNDPDYETRQLYSRLCDVPCFGPGTFLKTPAGDVPVEWLAPGDLLETLDNGVQKILWVGRFRVTAAQLMENPSLAPVRFARHIFGKGHPSRPLNLSGQHRVLLQGSDVELCAGVGQAFGAAAHLSNETDHRQPVNGRSFHYTHVLLERHEVIMANGLWVESLFLGEQIESALPDGIPDSIRALPAVQAGHLVCARQCLKKSEVRLILGGYPLGGIRQSRQSAS